MAGQRSEADEYWKALYERTPFSRASMHQLRISKVGILGDGSGGSAIAVAFAQAGVGEIRNADPERLVISNVSRHELDRTFVGKNKAVGVVERIHNFNPYIVAEAFSCDVFAEGAESARERFFDSLDLIIGTTDKTNVQLRLNREAVNRGIPAVFGGCYESARGGEVLFWLPGAGTPCLECLRGGLVQPVTTGNVDYSSASGPEDYEGEPGLHAAIDLISNIETQIALGVLLRDEPTSELGRLIDPRRNFLLIGGALAAGFYRFKRAFDIYWQPLAGPRTDCGACQPRKARLDSDASHELAHELSDVPDDLRRFLS